MDNKRIINTGQPDSFKEFEKRFPEVLDQLTRNKTRIQYLKGETVIKQGAFAPYVLLVVKGLVKIYLQTGYEKQVNISLAKTGDFLAYSSLFGETIHTYSAQTLKDSEICMVEKESMKQVLLENPQFALEITSKNYQIERHLLEIIKNLSYKQMRGKLASSLLYLSREEFLKEQVFEYLTRQELADFASVSAESAIKFLKEFEKDQIVRLDGKNIEITDRKKLEMLSKTS
jgi:CRP-like cAMP-binding protein